MVSTRHPIPSAHRSLSGMVRRRTEVAYLLFILAALLLTGRLVYLMALRGEYFAAEATAMNHREYQILARRGQVLARDGDVMVEDLVAMDIVANPRVVADKAAAARAVARLLGLDDAAAESMRRRMEEAPGYFVYLRRRVPRTDADLLGRNLDQPELAGVRTQEVLIRSIPAGGVAANVLGWTNIDGVGQAGIERANDPVLRGRNGRREARVDAVGRVIPQTERIAEPPQHGDNITITIDPTIQQIADAALDQVAEQYHPQSAVAVVLEVATGEVLAMSDWPRWDPTVDTRLDMNRRRIRAAADTYEPGSTFKVITAAAALEYGVDGTIYCGGTRTTGRYTIHCAHNRAHGRLDIQGVVRLSCNIGASMLAERVGPERLYQYVERLGLLAPTGLGLREESYFPLTNPAKTSWAEIRTWNVGFGQGVAVTPIQLVAAYAGILNNGVYAPPRLVKAVAEIPAPPPLTRRVATEETSRKMREYMESVVTAGTGTRAQVKHYSVGGKTGTAQLEEHGRYVSGAYVASFIGAVPIREPRLAILVSVTRPKGAQYGGVVAAPAFQQIAEQSLRYLEIPPDAADAASVALLQPYLIPPLTGAAE